MSTKISLIILLSSSRPSSRPSPWLMIMATNFYFFLPLLSADDYLETGVFSLGCILLKSAVTTVSLPVFLILVSSGDWLFSASQDSLSSSEVIVPSPFSSWSAEV